ncbi:hypothetical protein VTH82DRAFT_8734, partial [Thermothelomyces myriococcoides]
MKTAKPPAPEGVTGSSRRQPVRQTRVNPPRTTSLNRNNPLSGAPPSEQPINILPGVTHFADAITALPKELVRHFTLLKEVDAKIFAPEAALLQLLHDALNTPPPDFSRPVNDTLSSTASVSAAPMSTTGPANPAAPPSEATTSSVFDPANIPRRALFRDTALKIQEILVSLEEKNHVLATANDALQKQLARIEDIWPHLEAEFSEEAKWGSATHWAYVENRQAKTNDKQAERSRREGAATLSAAAQALAEEAAARSSDRKQAIAAKKNAKNQTADTDNDKSQDSGKRAQGTKSRKPLPDHGPVGLGITSASTGAASANKRRKVAETKSNGAPAERAMGSVFGANSTRRGTTSPRETPAPEGGGNKKRKALPTSSSQAKKSRTNAAMSPSVTSSPVVGALPDPVKPGRTSPAPSATTSRPASSRARQNSIHSNVDNSSRQRRPSVTSSKPSGNSQGTPDPAQQPSNGTKTHTDSKTQKEATVPIMSKPSPPKTEAEEPPSAPEPVEDDNDDNSAKQTDEQLAQSNKEAAPLGTQSTPASGVKTKSGRASKPSTPAIPTFAEAASSNASATTSRSRPSRSTDNSANNAASGTTANNQNNSTGAKRSHKKGASVSVSATAVSQATAAAAATASSSSSSASAGTSSSGASATTAAGKDKERDRDRGSGPGVGASGTAPVASGGKKDKTHSSTGNGGAGNNSSNSSSSSSSHGHNAGSRKTGAGAGAGAENEDDADEDEDQDVADEDVYCYCNQVSYGEMVACDGEGCPREWFHLECVGLKVAPKGN